MLDNTLLVWVNEHQKGNDHDRHQIPYVLAGKGGGAVKTGRWLQVHGDRAAQQPLGRLHERDGDRGKTFGNPKYCRAR